MSGGEATTHNNNYSKHSWEFFEKFSLIDDNFIGLKELLILKYWNNTAKI